MALLLGGSSEAVGQEASWFLPDRESLPSLLAGPRDPVAHAKFVMTFQSPTRFDPGLEGEVSLGTSLPVFRFAEDDASDALVIGVGGAVYGHFSLQTLERDLMSTDWIILVPVVWRREDHWLRVAYHHISSHLGDDYAKRFNVTAIDYGRDAADATVYLRPHAAIGVYGGVNVAYNVHPDSAGRFTLRLGAEIDPDMPNDRFTPYGAVDVALEQDVSWEPRVNVQFGARFPRLGSRRLIRMGMEFQTGPAAQRQFYDRRSTQISLGIWLDL